MVDNKHAFYKIMNVSCNGVQYQTKTTYIVVILLYIFDLY